MIALCVRAVYQVNGRMAAAAMNTLVTSRRAKETGLNPASLGGAPHSFCANGLLEDDAQIC
jgi:hypothetical protein